MHKNSGGSRAFRKSDARLSAVLRENLHEIEVITVGSVSYGDGVI